MNLHTTRSHADGYVNCRDGKVTISGHVKHDRGPGCAKVKAVFEGQITEVSAESCGLLGGPERSFTWTHPGSTVNAYLMED